MPGELDNDYIIPPIFPTGLEFPPEYQRPKAPVFPESDPSVSWGLIAVAGLALFLLMGRK